MPTVAAEASTNVALRRSMTAEEFLAWEQDQDDRWEFDGFAPVAMLGGTPAYSLVTTNIVRAAGNRLAGTSCHIYNDSLQLTVAGNVRYPDAFVASGDFANTATTAEEPIVVFEVLSQLIRTP